MKSRIAFALAFLSCLALPVVAQTPYEATFRLEGLLPHDPVMTVNTGSGNFQAYSSPYVGGLMNSGDADFTLFEVYCVDELHDAHIGDQYLAWITNVGGFDFSHTRLGGAEQTEYEWAAYLASNINYSWMLGPGGDATFSADQAQTVALQDAIWALLGEGVNASGRLSTFESSTLAANVGISPGTDFDVAPSFGGFDPSGWSLITCAPQPGQPVSSCSGQEFLVQVAPPQEVPEPGTMSLMATGLAGLVGFDRKRRRRA